MSYKLNLISFGTLFTKELVRIIRIWPQSIVPPVITASLYFLIFGRLIGSQIAGIGGYSFMHFIIPGLVMGSLLTNAYVNTAFSVYAMRFSRCIEEIIISPTPKYVVILGFTMAAIMRGVITAVIITLVSMFFVHFHMHHIIITLLVAFLASFIFATLGIVNGMLARNFDDASLVPTFVITPLTYLGGVFYSIDMVPKYLQYFTMINPIYYIISAFRYGFLGVGGVNIYMALLVLTGMALASFIGAYIWFDKSKM